MLLSHGSLLATPSRPLLWWLLSLLCPLLWWSSSWLLWLTSTLLLCLLLGLLLCLLCLSSLLLLLLSTLLLCGHLLWLLLGAVLLLRLWSTPWRGRTSRTREGAGCLLQGHKEEEEEGRTLKPQHNQCKTLSCKATEMTLQL